MAWGSVVLAAALALSPGDAWALYGRVELRGSHQEGRTGVQAFTTNTQWQIMNIGQQVDFGQGWLFRVDATGRREKLWGESAFTRVDTDKKFMMPSASLLFRNETYRFNLNSHARRVDQMRTGAPTQRDEFFDIGFWFNANYDWLRLDANFQEAVSWRYVEGDDRENRNRQASAQARWFISSLDELRYKFTLTRQKTVNFGLENTYTSNNLQYRGSHRFAEDRGSFSITAIHNHFKQEEKRDDTTGLQYVLPAFGGFVIDDTPESLDPLEGDPISEPALYDRDQTTPTVINIGDDAPIGRDYGGDFRNIILDFGDTQEMQSLILYVDQILRFPSLMEWDIYVNDTADGRDWDSPLSPASYTINYVEYETGRQGWVVVFDTPIQHRRIKMVNRKLGLTEPSIAVTEFELYQTAVFNTEDRESTTLRQRLEGGVSYQFTRGFRAFYNGNFDRRTYDAADRDLNGISNLVGAEYRFTHWILSGQYDHYTLRGPTNRDTDASTKILSLSRNRDRAVYGRFSLQQTIDDSYDTKYTTNSATLDFSWRIAPRLLFNQKVTYSTRSALEFDFESDSWGLISEIRSNPRSNMNLDLKHTDRWVSEDFGTGFTNYNDTEVNASWTIFPYLNYAGQFVYHVRDEEDYLIRNSLSLAPLPGGSALFQLYVRDYQDTRTDRLRRGGGASVTWKPRPRLNLSGGIEKFYERIEGERGYPVSYNFRGYWTF